MSDTRYDSETLGMFLGFLERKGLMVVVPNEPLVDAHLKSIDGAVCLALEKTNCQRNAFRTVFKSGKVVGDGWTFKEKH